MMPLLLLISLICLYSFSSTVTGTVELNSSSKISCPGDTLIFTCVTNTGQLRWRNTINNIPTTYFQGSPVNETNEQSGITTKLTDVSGTTFTSTFTVEHVLPEYDQERITCFDKSQEGTGEEQSQLIELAVPSQPLNVTVMSCFSYHSITWASPLGTPLCVHSYTVTVRNDSSPMMVYHTTGNVTSLLITDLSPKEEYTVTVAGRDGTGRLGEETNVSLTPKHLYIPIEYHYVLLIGDRYGILINWKPENSSDTQKCNDEVYYVVSHNVSGEQSPITVNRTNVTLYGVLPGDIYCVEVTAKLMKHSIIKSHRKVFINFQALNFETESGSTLVPVWILMAVLVISWILLLLIIGLLSVRLCKMKSQRNPVVSKPVVYTKEQIIKTRAQLTSVLKDNTKELKMDEVNSEYYDQVGTTAVAESFRMDTNLAYSAPTLRS